MRLYFIRHGETDYNKVGRIQGRLDIDMNLMGFKQARLLHHRLIKTDFDYIFSSPLKRAVDTASEIIRDRDMVIYKMSELTDTDFGKWQGQLRSALSKKFKLSAEDSSEMLAMRGGEDFTDVYKRMLDFMAEISDLNAKNILVSTHAVIIYAALKMALSYPPEQHLSILLDNCGITVLERDNKGKWLVRAVNDVSHLDKY